MQWDGVRDGYIPVEPQKIDPDVLPMHTEAGAEVDPFTYEIVRYNLWNVNEEHGDTIVKVSGSPIAVFGHDFNPTILTETGEFVFFGPYIQFHSGMIDANVKWTLEHRADNPGIHKGDMFIANDPWVGTPHQHDTAMIAPVFIDGRLFCWVANMIHLADVGGPVPGSFCPDADDVFAEPPPTPPMKIVEGGVVRRDIEDEFVRRSRMPDLVRLDIRAVIAGNNVAKRRILELVDRYGPAVVKTVMRRVIDDSEQRFVNRISGCADGKWSSIAYIEVAKAGDRKTYKSVVTMEKRGDRLIFGNEGTDAQTGAINITFAGFRGAILCPINAFMLHDSLYAIGGAVRHLDFDMTPGTITCASHPAACSNGGTTGVNLVVGQGQNVVARMLMTNPDLERSFVAQGGPTMFPGLTSAGIDQRGRPFGAFWLDPMGGAIGARSFGDGDNTGGIWYDPKGFMPNIEETEQTAPVLCLYRREVPGSGGAGTYRGGNAGEWSFVPHKTEGLTHATSASGAAIPPAVGLSGGQPGAPNEFKVVRGSTIREQLASGLLPDEVAGLGGVSEAIPPKATGIAQGPDDVIIVRWAAAGGFGDPLGRDPELVLNDIEEGDIAADQAESVYGVVIAGDKVDAGGTAERRDAMVAQRMQEASAPSAEGERL
jgi:N-methylhydantoinase B